MRQRSATCCGVPCAASQWRTCWRCSGDRESGGLERGMTPLSGRSRYISGYLLDTTLALPVWLVARTVARSVLIFGPVIGRIAGLFDQVCAFQGAVIFWPGM